LSYDAAALQSMPLSIHHISLLACMQEVTNSSKSHLGAAQEENTGGIANQPCVCGGMPRDLAQLAKVGYGEFWDEEKAILEICLASLLER
jgi:hypothetical protein